MIQGNYCVLESIDIDKHANTLFENLSLDNRGESWTYLPYGPFKHIDELLPRIIVRICRDAPIGAPTEESQLTI